MLRQDPVVRFSNNGDGLKDGNEHIEERKLMKPFEKAGKLLDYIAIHELLAPIRSDLEHVVKSQCLENIDDENKTKFLNVLEEGSNEVAVENAIALFLQSSEAEQPTVHNFCSNFDKKYLKELNVALLRQDLEDPEVCFSWASFQKCLRRRLRGMVIATFGNVEQAGLDCPKSLSPNRKTTGQETTARKGEVTSQETITRKQKSPATRNRKTTGVTRSDSLVTGIQHSRAKKTFRSEEERALIAQLYEKHKNGYPKWKLIHNEAAPYLDHLTTQQIQDCVKTLIKQGHVAP